MYSKDTGANAPPDVLLHVQLEWDTDKDFAEFMLAYGQLLDISDLDLRREP